MLGVDASASGRKVEPKVIVVSSGSEVPATGSVLLFTPPRRRRGNIEPNVTIDWLSIPTSHLAPLGLFVA